ncbi:MAG: esterase-like activity of phytase family protein [Burkholderiales bacterium]|nr:esterase-like activity of phytase family protein [Burkholderiales bacterium]
MKEIDTRRDGVIAPKDALQGVLREPDAVAWLDDTRFVTANEGDYQGGSRGFSIWNVDGKVEYDSGAFLDHEAIRLGHYPEKRSGAKGNEPEGAEVGVFGKDRLIFIGSERSSLVSVWQTGPWQSAAPQSLVGPRPLPQRAVAQPTVRPGVSIYARTAAQPVYPTLMSSDSASGTPIAWGAISGLTADRQRTNTLWAVTDSAYAHARILKIDTSLTPAMVTDELVVRANGKPVPGLDAEGVAQREDGSFWIASEGNPDAKGVLCPTCCCACLPKAKCRSVLSCLPRCSPKPNALAWRVWPSQAVVPTKPCGWQCNANGRTTPKAW